MQPTSVDLTIEFMSNTIYNYFANLYGTVNSTNHTNARCGKYKHLTPKSLKHQLKQLKMNDAPLQEIKYVSQFLRSKLKCQDSTHSSATAVNQDRYVSKNFWGFVKNAIEKGSAVLPSFSRDHCDHSGGRWVYSSSGAVPPLYLLVPSATMSLSALG